MKLIRFGEPGKEKPGIINEDKWFDVSSFIKDYDEDFFANGGIENLKKIVAENKLPEIDIEQRSWLPGL